MNPRDARPTRSDSEWQAIRAAAQRAAHGTNARYSTGCRCNACRIGRAEYSRNRPYNNRGHGRTVDADPARRHILCLAKKGMGYLAVAQAAKVNHNIVWGIRQGVRTRARYGTVRRILDVDLSCSRDGSRIPAGPTWKILDGLIGDGYAKMQLARWLGYGGKYPSLQFRRDFVTAANAGRVQRVAALIEMGKLTRGGDSCLSKVKPRGRGGARPGRYCSDAPRCACGKMTLKCAKARSHHCEPSVPARTKTGSG